MEKKKKVLISSLVFVVVAVLIGMIVFAATTTTENNYVVDVIDDGAMLEKVSEDGDAKFQTVIKSSTDTELTYETIATNATEHKKKVVGVYIDTSYSITQNATFNAVKNDAVNLVDQLINEVNADWIVLGTNTGATVGISNLRENLKTDINNLSANSASSISYGLNRVKGVFDGIDSSYEKYLIIYSDATDDVTTELQAIEDADVKIYSVLTNITSTSFGDPSNPNPASSTVYNMDNLFNNKNIIDEINKNITNVKLVHQFNYDILKQNGLGNLVGNFEVESISATKGSATQLSNGNIEWDIGEIGTGNPAKLTFKLKLNTTKTIGTDSIYNKIDTIKTSMEYVPNGGTETKSFKEEDYSAPSIQICDAYDLKLNAVGEKSNQTLRDGISFYVTATDDSGNILSKYCKTVELNEKGEFVIPKIKELGRVYFNIQPIVSSDLVGFTTSASQYVIVNNEYDSVSGGKLTVERIINYEKIDDNGKRSVTLNIPISEQTFNINLDLYDKDGEFKISEGTFKLIMPKRNNQYEMDVLEATTNNGHLTFEAPVMTKAGEYKYILVQEAAPTGYDLMGNPDITIKFKDDGTIEEISGVDGGIKIKNDNGYLKGERVNEAQIDLKAYNKNPNLTKSNLRIKLTDTDTNEGIGGAIYQITVISGTSYQLDPKSTDSDGTINNIELPYIKSNGTTSSVIPVIIRVEEKAQNNAYEINTNLQSPGRDYVVNIDTSTGLIDSIPQGWNQELKQDPSDPKGLLLELKAKRKVEQNIVRITLKDKDDSSVLTGVPITLKNVNDSSEQYTETTVNGIAEFTLKAPGVLADDRYTYDVYIDPANMPAGYTAPTIDGKIEVSVSNGGKITGVADKNQNIQGNPLSNLTSTIENNATSVDYTITGDFEIEATSPNELYIELTDEQGAPIEKAKYKISVDYPGSIFTKTLPIRKTNSTGNIDPVRISYVDPTEPTIITITQMDYDSSINYKKNDITYQILVKQDGTGMKIDGTVNITDPINQVVFGNGGTDSNKIIFKDINKTIKADDVLYKLRLEKYEVKGYKQSELQDEHLMIWGDDGEFRVYDESTGTFKSANKADQCVVKTANSNDATDDMPIGTALCYLNPINLVVPDQADEKIKRNIYIAEYNMITNQPIEESLVTLTIYFRYDNNQWRIELNDYIKQGTSTVLDGNISAHGPVADIVGYRTWETQLRMRKIRGESNFAIDFTKYAYAQNPADRKKLDGAKYKVEVKSPSGGTTRTGNDSYSINNNENTIDVDGLYLEVGSNIIIAEDPNTYPPGYENDSSGETFIVKAIDKDTGIVTLKQATSNSSPTRIELRNATIDADGDLVAESSINSDGKSVIQIDLIDTELNTLNVGITTVDDNNRTQGLEGNSYHILSSSGAQTLTGESDTNGIINTTIGGDKKHELVTYTITQNMAQGTKVTQYYKRAASIDVQMYFDDNGNIVTDPSDTAHCYDLIQTDPNYKQTWDIITVNGTNKFEIVIYKKKASALNVNITTKDAFYGTTLSGIASYEITPSEDIIAQGTTNLQVGYIQDGTLVPYTLKTTIIGNTYRALNDQPFKILYENDGKIKTNNITAIGNNISITANATNDETIDIIVYLEPTLTFQIHNETFYSSDDIVGAKFQIIDDSDSTVSNIEQTDSSGNALIYHGKYENEGVVRTYTIHQVDSGDKTIAKIKDFKINVTFDGDGYIDTVEISPLSSDIENAGLVVDLGDKRINRRRTIVLTIKSYPAFRMNITNIEKGSNNDSFPTYPVYISSTQYKIESDIPTECNPTPGTNSTGETIAYLDRTEFNTQKTYTITEVNTAYGYQKLESPVEIKVVFDENGLIKQSSTSVIIASGESCCTLAEKSSGTNPEDNFIVNVRLENAPKFRMNITNFDKISNDQLGGSKWKVYVDGTDSSTANEGTASQNSKIFVPVEDATPISDYLDYIIENTESAVGYQKIHAKIKIRVYFGSDGYVYKAEVIDGEDYIKNNQNMIITPLTCSTDNFAIDVEIKSAPTFRVNITNFDKVTSDQLGGSKWKAYVEGGDPSTANEEIAAQSSKVYVPVEDETPISNYLYYIIENTESAVGYQKIHAKIKIRVDFGPDGDVENATIIDGKDYIKNDGNMVIPDALRINSTDYFAIDVEMKSAPNSIVNITNVDRTDPENIQLGGSEWEVTLESADPTEATSTQGKGTTNVTSPVSIEVNGETPIRTSAVYVIKNTKAATNYQKIENPIKIQVEFDEFGYINIDNSKFNTQSCEYCIEKIEAISPRSSTDSKDYYTFNVVIKSSPKTKVNITNIERETTNKLTESEWSIELEGSGYSAVNGYIPSSATETSVRVDGETPMNSDAIYIIKNIKAANGYQRIEKDIKIRVTFGSDGVREGVIINDNSANPLKAEGDRVYCVDGTLLTVETTRTSPEDYYTFNITIISTPLSRINFTNIGRADGTPLSNTEWKLELEGTTETPAPNITTAVSGDATVEVQGETPYDGDAIYKITNIDNNGNGYQVLTKEIRVQVHFTSSHMDNISVIDGDNDILKALITSPTNLREHLTFDIEIKNSPLIKMYIDNIDRSDASVPSLIGSEFKIHTKDQHSVETDDSVTKTTVDPAQLSVRGDTGVNPSYVTYTITQVKSATGYQSMEPKDIKIYFNDNGTIDTSRLNEAVVDTAARRYLEVKAKSTIVTNEDAFTLEITVKSNPLIAVTIHTVTMGGNDIPGAQYSGKAKNITGGMNTTMFTYPSTTTPVSPTDTSGLTTIYIDKGLDNSTIQYSFDEDQVAGHQKLPFTALINVNYDQDGKIDSASNVTSYTDPSHSNYITNPQITGNFSIEITIKNEEIGNFQLEVDAVDVYDRPSNTRCGKVLDGAEIKAIVYEGTGEALTKKYRDNTQLTAEETLVTGVTQHGYATQDFGGTLKFGKVDDTTKITTATIELYLDKSPTSYYNSDENKSYPSSYYDYYEYKGKTTKFIAIVLQFDDNGRIIANSAQVKKTWEMTKDVDEIIKVKYTTDYRLKIEVGYYPMLTTQMNAISGYDDKIDLSASYEVRLRNLTSDSSEGKLNNQDKVKILPDVSAKGWLTYYKELDTEYIPYKQSAYGNSVVNGYFPNLVFKGYGYSGIQTLQDIWKISSNNHTYWTYFLPSRIFNQTTGDYEKQVYPVINIQPTKNDATIKLKEQKNINEELKVEADTLLGDASQRKMAVQKFYIYETNSSDKALLPNEPKDDSDLYYGTDGVTSEQYHKIAGNGYSSTTSSSNSLNKRLATVLVGYNKYGEVIGTALYSDNNNTNSINNIQNKVNWNKDTSITKDGNKIAEIKISDDKHGVEVTFEYQRTTTLTAKVIDDTTLEPIKDIAYTVFDNKDNKAYIQYKSSYNNLWKSNDEGKLTLEYNARFNLIGGTSNTKLTVDKIIYNYKNVAYGSTDVNGVDIPSNKVFSIKWNKAKSGKSIKDIDKYYTVPDNVSVNVQYDNIGEIAETLYDNSGNVAGKTYVTSTYSDSNHSSEANASIESIQNTTVNLNILFYRTFKVTTNSKDMLSGNTINGAKYNITAKDSSGNILFTRANVGEEDITGSDWAKAYPGETIEYTVEQASSIDGYRDLAPFSFYIYYCDGVDATGANVRGKIGKIYDANGTLYDGTTIYPVANSPIEVNDILDWKTIKDSEDRDLEITIKREPTAYLTLTLSDQFYKNEKLDNVSFDVVVKDTVSGETIKNTTKTTGTNGNGTFKIDLDRTLIDTTISVAITQNTTLPGYYDKAISTIRMYVDFNAQAKIDDYYVYRGADDQLVVQNIVGTRNIGLDVYNKPREVKLEIDKYDGDTNEALKDVEFTITREIVGGATTTLTTSAETDENGKIIFAIDNFEENATTERDAIYTIEENKAKETYRKIGIIKFRIHYKNDGSIDFKVNEDIPATGVVVNVSSSGSYINSSDKIAVQAKIANDNLYDIIIKDEDINYPGLGIQGTKYDLSVNGNTKTISATNASGITTLTKNKESGTIEIVASEQSIGTGYRENLNNNIKLEFEKGISEYSLELKKQLLFSNKTSTGYEILSTTDPYISGTYGQGIKYEIEIDSASGTTAEVAVYEETGKIEIIFKNETKSQIILNKIDAKTTTPLEGAEFSIISEEIDNYGVAVPGTQTIITSDPSTVYKTNNEGKLVIDIGVRPQNKKIKYTFQETVAPADYNPVEIFNIVCTYDQYGNITTDGGDSGRVYVANNKFDIELAVKNGDDPEGYTIKIVSADSTATGNKINGSQFRVEVTDDSGNVVSATSSAQEPTSTKTNSFGMSENGVIYLTGITTEGTINIEVAQTGYVTGYVAGTNTVYGTAVIETKFEPASLGSITTVPKFTKLSDGGFAQVEVSEKYKEIVITVTNDPQITLDIHKISTLKDKNGNEIPIPGVKFTVTSQIYNPPYLQVTDLEETGTTNEDGNITIPLGMPVNGKEVIYTIKEDTINGYNSGLEFKIVVDYLNNGKIRECGDISDDSVSDYIEIEETTSTGENILEGRTIPIKIKNEKIIEPIPYTVIVETETDDGTPVDNIPVNLKINEADSSGMHIYSAKTTEMGTRADGQTNVAQTDPYTGLSGTGLIQFFVDIENDAQIKAGLQFHKDMQLELTKDPETGAISIENENNIGHTLVDYDMNSGRYVIRLIAKAIVGDDNYIININKLSKASGSSIKNNKATFTLVKYSPIEDEDDMDDGDVELEDEEDDDATVTTPTSGIKYYITYDANTTDTVTDLPTQQEFEENASEVKLDSTSPIREGYVFRGWAENTTISDTDELTRAGHYFGTDNQDYTLYAIWTKESEYFDGDTEDIITAEENGNNGLLTIKGLKVPSKSGWYRYALTEDTAPTGYKGLTGTEAIDIHFETVEMTNGSGVNYDVMYISEYKTYSNKIDVKIKDSGRSIWIDVNNDEDIGEGKYQLNIFKVDANTVNNDPATGIPGALFRVTLPDTLVTGVYMESGEQQNAIAGSLDSGRLDYSYIEENKEDPSVRLSKMEKPTVEEVKATADGKITREYTFVERAAPDGYALIPIELKLEVDFEVTIDSDGNESVIITDARDMSSDTSYIQIKDISDNAVRAYILNTEQTSSYTVHYEGNGTVDPATGTSDVTNVPADQIKMPGTPLTLDANIPVRTGYTFLGWDPDSAATTATYSAGGQYGIDADVTLYAIWTVAKYDIIYKDNAPIDPATGLPIGLVNDMPANATKTHGIDYTIEPDMITVMTLPSIQGHTSEYSFAGWSTEPDGIDPVTGGPAGTYNPGDIYRKDTALTLYAQWNYIITYDENVPVDPAMSLPLGNVISGMPYDTNSYKQEVPVNSTTSAIIHDTSLYPDDPTMDVDYEFKEWNTKPDGTGTSYAKDSLYEDASGNPIKESVTLYAIWMYKIEYLENIPDDSITGLPASNTVNNMPYPTALGNYVQKETASSDASIPAVANISSNILTTTPSDYDFAGWNTAPDGSGDAYVAGATYTGNKSVKLYAQWTYTIKYITNEPIDPDTGLPVGSVDSNWPADQTDISTNTDATIDDQSIYAGVPTLDGYVFVGWDPNPNLDPETSTPMYTIDPTTPTKYTDHKNIELYAIWKEEDLYLKVKDGVDYMITDATIGDENKQRVTVTYSAQDDGTEKEYSDGDKYLIGLLPRLTATLNRTNYTNNYQKGTTLNDLKNNLDTNGIIKVYKVDFDPITDAESKGDEITNDDSLMGTGMYLEITNKLNTKIIELRIIVKGDLEYKDTSTIILNEEVQTAKLYSKKQDRARSNLNSICGKLAMDVALTGILDDNNAQRIEDMRWTRCNYSYKDRIMVILDAGDGIILDIEDGPVTTTDIYVWEGVNYFVNWNHTTTKMYQELPKAEKPGYTFGGWRDKATGQIITDSTIVTDTLTHEFEAIYY